MTDVNFSVLGKKRTGKKRTGNKRTGKSAQEKSARGKKKHIEKSAVGKKQYSNKNHQSTAISTAIKIIKQLDILIKLEQQIHIKFSMGILHNNVCHRGIT